MGVPEVERDAAVRSVVVAALDAIAADQRTQPLVSEYACLAHRRRHRHLLLFEVRLRNTVTALGVTVTLATFPLGIHWVADILAGAAAVALSVALARRVTDTSEREALALGHTVSLREKRVV
jgi:hypothetical protein